ncbi:MAG TPA: CTP synthase [Candidatus Aenigmarchaeota archaeon]|nr:CTP synthase [Candidatus Aenigmarchaeota archaeon]
MNKLNKNLKFVFIVGGVLSGLGKGVVTASIGKLIKDSGYKITAIKIDPYVNVDAGTMRPTEHGEIFVTEDGGEIDQDFGTYERFLDINLSKNNNITTGKVYLNVIQKERALEYGGRDVKLIPDIVDEIKKMILYVSQNVDVAIVEVGGTTGDIENLIFLYAIRELMQEYTSTAIMVSYVPLLKNVGELKTKPTQHAMAKIRETGIFPDFIVIRSETGLDKPRIEKIARSCFIQKENIIDDPNIECIYELPIIFEKQKFGEKILKKLGLKYRNKNEEWKKFVNKIKNLNKKVKICLVGKYVSFGDAEHKDVYVSVIEAIKHASYYLRARPEIEQIFSIDIKKEKCKKILSKYDGIIIPGGFGETGVEGKIETIRYCRENNIPFLGLCFGMQLAVVEFARNVCGLNKAHTTEIEPNTSHPVIDILPEQEKLIKRKMYGATMRLGAWPTILKKGSKVFELYRKEKVSEIHRHRYEVNPKYIEILEKNGLVFSGKSPDSKLMEFLELPGHKFFIATQAHPEFKSRLLKPHPLFVGFIKSCL